MVNVTYGAIPSGAPAQRGRPQRSLFAGVAALSVLVAVGIVALAAQDWDDGSVTLAQMQQQEAADRAHMQSLGGVVRPAQRRPADRAHMQSLGGVVRGAQFSEDTAANPEGAVLENVPATVVAPVPGPPDFNGA